MGEVYRARDVRLERPVAIKVLRPDGRRVRSIDVVRAGGAHRVGAEPSERHHDLRHRKVEALPYIAMEFVEGQTLRTLLESGPSSVPRLLDLAIQMATALQRPTPGASCTGT